MVEKERLSHALRRSASTEWASTALFALDDQQVVFAGNPGTGASNTVRDLLRIYRLRQNHCREKGINAQGLTELIESLARLPEGDAIQVQPFLGPTSSVTAFWDTTGNLVGCVTILGRDPEIGQRNLDAALGKP